jgi:hypothetical protein
MALGEVQWRVHEDLFCATSGRFHRAFQANRRCLPEVCSQCQIEVGYDDPHVAFCQDCGLNSHIACLNLRAGTMDSVTCPRCNSRVNPEEEVRSAIILLECGTSVEAIDMYVGWQYSGLLNIDLSYTWGTEELNNLLANAWRLSIQIDDAVFRSALIAEFLDRRPHEANSSPFSVAYLQKVWMCGEELSGFDTFCLAVLQSSQFPTLAMGQEQEIHREFLVALYNAAVGSQGVIVDVPAILSNFTEGRYRLYFNGIFSAQGAL